MVTSAPVVRHDFKAAFLIGVLDEFGGRPLRLLDLGSGTSKDFVGILHRYPAVHYTGVEPDEGARAEAARLLAGRDVTLIGDWGEALSRRFDSAFDVTLSLSVLEHVKYLEAFLNTSVAVTRPGGRIVHRYDLGHALHPVSWIERLLVSASVRMPALVPARIFTGAPDPRVVAEMLSRHGAIDLQVRHAQMPSLKAAMNRLPWKDGQETRQLAERMVALDSELAAVLTPALTPAALAKLFPSITVSGVRKNP